MRLICPNCDAQYEVVDDVIPADGRDVQCSNCGQTWFQHHPDHAPSDEALDDLPPDLAEPDDAPGEDEERSETAPPPAPDLDPEPELEPEPEPEPQQRSLDPDVAGILREEAEREAQARAASGIETQPDLGLDSAESESDRRAREARERMARLRGEAAPEEPHAPGPEAVATAAAVGSRRELLPDIEEINSSLRSSGEREQRVADPSPDTAEQTPKRSGFRRGFLLMIVIALVLAAIYIFAPQIARSVPQVDPFLSAYVAQVDSMRTWLDGLLQQGLQTLDDAATQSN